VPKKIYQLKIQLQGVKNPPVWRKVLMPATDMLLDLHNVIQGAMGWYDAHLHQFIHGNTYYCLPMPGYDDFGRIKDERNFKISQLLTVEKQAIQYEYDFGDGWLHKITLEAILTAKPEETYPRLIRGKGACPFEDCGGVWGYEELKDILNNPEHPEYEERREWLGFEEDDVFDPNEFDLAAHHRNMLIAYNG
jgi:hypothetical protein